MRTHFKPTEIFVHKFYTMCVTIGFLVIEFFHAYAQKNTIFHVESLDQQSVNATSSPSVTRKQLLLVLNCNSHLSCPFV